MFSQADTDYNEILEIGICEHQRPTFPCKQQYDKFGDALVGVIVDEINENLFLCCPYLYGVNGTIAGGDCEMLELELDVMRYINDTDYGCEKFTGTENISRGNYSTGRILECDYGECA